MCILCDGAFVHHCHCSVPLCSSKSVSGKVEESEVSRARRLAGLQEEPKAESKLCTAIAIKSNPCRLWTVNDSDAGEVELESKVDRGRRRPARNIVTSHVHTHTNASIKGISTQLVHGCMVNLPKRGSQDLDCGCSCDWRSLWE